MKHDPKRFDPKIFISPDHLNHQHPAIQVTIEEELEGKIPFLDVLVEKHGTGVQTSVFRKKTHTDRYINFKCHHHPRILSGVVKCLKDRADKVCHHTTKSQEIEHLKQVFRANGFPESSLKKILDGPIRRDTPTPTPTTVEEERQKVIFLPYVHGLSQKIENICRRLGIKTIFKSSNTLRQSLVHVKNSIPEEKKKGVVYEVPCMDCEQVPIGETGRTMQKRVTEHKTAMRKYDKKNGIAVHAWRADDRIEWEAARVGTRAAQYWKRRVVEDLQIQKQSSRMNLDCGLDISSIWKSLLIAERSTSQLLPMY